MAGDDLGVEGGYAALDPNLADAQVADVAGILLGVGGAVAVVEECVGIGGGEGSAVPVAALGGHHIGGVPLAVEFDSGAGGSLGIRVAAHGGPVVGVLVVDFNGAGAERLIDVLHVDGAGEHACGVRGDLGGIQLVAGDCDGSRAVGVADPAAGRFRLRQLVAARVNMGDIDVARACACRLVNEGNGVNAACGYGAAGRALRFDQIIVKEQVSVGGGTVGHACLVFGGLGFQNGAALIDMVDGQGAGSVVDVQVVEARLVNQHGAALGGDGIGVARNLAEAGQTGGVAVGDNDPAGTVEGDGIRLGAAVDEHCQLVPLAGAAVGVGVGDDVAPAGLEGRRHDAAGVQRVVVLADGEQTLVVIRQTRHLGYASPVNGVDGVGGFVGVVVALLGSAEFGACRHERNTLRGEQKGVDLLHLLLEFRVGARVVGGAVTLDDLIPHDQVIVGVGVGDRLRGTLGRGGGVNVALYALNDLIGVGFGVALYKAGAGAVGVALDTVAVLVAERANSGVEAGDAGAFPAEDLVGVAGGSRSPRFTVHQNLLTGAVGVVAVEVASDLVHGGYIMQTHEVEAEAVDVVLVHPVEAGLDHVFAEHLLIGGCFVAAARTVGVFGGGGHAVVVAGSRLFKAGLCVEGVVVYHVHDDGNASVMERLDHLLELPDSDVAVVGVGGVGAFGRVVVLRIVAPVAVGGGGSGFIYGLEVVNGHELHAVDALLNQVVDAGGIGSGAACAGGACFGKAEVFAPVVVADAGGLGGGEVTHMDLPHDRLAGVLEHNVVVAVPAVRVGGVEVYNHGTVAVDADRLGVNVLRLVGFALDVDDVGVILVLVVAVKGQAPHARGAVLGHFVLADHSRALLAVRAGVVELHLDGSRFGRPGLEGGGCRRVGTAEVFFVVRVARVGFQIRLVTVAGGGGGKGRRAHCHERRQQQRYGLS